MAPQEADAGYLRDGHSILRVRRCPISHLPRHRNSSGSGDASSRR
jgi:hypothetical protein